MATADAGSGAPQSRRQSWIDGPELAQDLSGHAQVIRRAPLHPGSAQVDEHVGDAEDGAPVIDLCD